MTRLRGRGGKIKRRAYLYLVAAGIGAAAGINEVTDIGQQDILPAGGERTATRAAPGGDGSRSVIVPTTDEELFSISIATSFSALSTPSVTPNITVVTDTRGWGVHLNYDDTKPINLESVDGSFGVSIADSLGDVPTPSTTPWFIFIDGSDRNWGVHVYDDGKTGIFTGDDFEFGLEQTLGDVAESSSTYQLSFIMGPDRTWGIHANG